MRTFPTILLGGLLSCGRYETGIDRSVLRGTLTLAPVTLTEEEESGHLNDIPSKAVDLGFVANRAVQIKGTCLDFSKNQDQEPVGDKDMYAFTALQDGSFTFVLEYASAEISGDTAGTTDGVVYALQVYDLDALDGDGNPTLVGGGSTEGAYGYAEVVVDLVAKGSYAVRVGGLTNDVGASGDYTLTMPGFDPNGKDFLVGAYQSADIFDHGDPVGGTSVSTFTWDASALTWTGSFEILYIRAVSTTYDTAGKPTNAIDEAVPAVYLTAADFNSLNSGILAGNMYASASVEVALSTDDATQDIHEDLAVTIDQIQPLQVGWTTAEVEPNDVTVDTATYNLVGDLAGAQVLPVGTGLGYVDYITGALEYGIDDPAYTSDADIYAFTVSAESSANFALEWTDTSADLDIHLYDSTGGLIAAGWYIANTNPESFTPVDFGFLLVPGETYYLGVLGYAGAAGTKDYTVGIEYTTP